MEATVSGHGTAPRGQDLDLERDPPPQGRFGRMFPELLPCKLSDRAIGELVKWMRKRSQLPNLRIPAGFTYLGQFIDHDITFDPTSKLDQERDPGALTNFRTPRLDLDSLYGSGPVVQPFLYDWCDPEPHGARLLVGRNSTKEGIKFEDLPRNCQGRALTGDMRNDENAIIAQLQLLFIRFHNAVVEKICRDGKARDLEVVFARAQETVRWHYQWIVVHEFLPLVVGETMANNVLPRPADGAKPEVHRKFFRWRREHEPYIPVEFAVAAYRFGHSMIRDEYRLAPLPRGAGFTLDAGQPVPLFPELKGFRPLEREHVIDWGRFFALSRAGEPPQRSQLIDTALARALFDLPDTDKDHRELARRTLRRGRARGLPSGQDVAAVMHEQPLSYAELQLKNMTGKTATELNAAAPLWYYILCETSRAVDANQAGEHLGPVGGRIVAEVIAGLLEADPKSYLNSEEPWAPTLRSTKKRDFRMADLVDIAKRGVRAPA